MLELALKEVLVDGLGSIGGLGVGVRGQGDYYYY